MPAPIIMVHGAFCGGWVFEHFRTPFERRGHKVLTPDLIAHQAGSPLDATSGVSMTDYAQQIATLCGGCQEPPILIGHSMGGLVAQLAATRTPLSALILLAPSAPWGIAGASLEEAASAVSLYALGPYWLRSVDPDYALAKHYSLDRMDRLERRAVYARMVPESGLALWQTLNWWLDPFMTTNVSTSSISCPVLGIAGGHDVIHPPATVQKTVARLAGRTRVIEAMSHWIPGEPGWDQAADFSLDWLSQTLGVCA